MGDDVYLLNLSQKKTVYYITGVFPEYRGRVPAEGFSSWIELRKMRGYEAADKLTALEKMEEARQDLERLRGLSKLLLAIPTDIALRKQKEQFDKIQGSRSFVICVKKDFRKNQVIDLNEDEIGEGYFYQPIQITAM